MTFRTSFILSNYLLGSLALACLMLSQVVSPLAGGALILGLGGCFLLEIDKTLPISPPSRIVLSNWAFLLIPILYFLLDVHLIDLVVWFLAFLMFTRFIFKTELNDYLFSHLIAIVCLLIGALYVQDLVFGFIFLGFYLVLCWGLIFYNMMVERVGSRCPPDGFKSIGDREKVGGTLFGLSAAMMILSLTLTSLIFISFPRLGLGFLALQAQGSPISGFSDTVRLGDVGKIKQNEAVVMRVQYSQHGKPFRPRSRILWRGVVLDHYDGERWTTTADIDWETRNRPGSGIKVFKIAPVVEAVRQEVYMEFFDSNVVFTHGIPMLIDGSFRSLQMDQNFSIKTTSRNPGPKRFFMLSDIGHAGISFNSVMPQYDPEVFPARFLQLPALSKEIRQLAHDLTRDASTPRAKTRKILDHFSTGFGYSLDLEAPPGRNALDHFLFTRKKGHCEYYASAMVVLLRLAGIPARLVNGFVGVEWNQLGDYMIVRQKHAHSWVEAFLPNEGWALFDPTPPDPEIAQSKATHPLALTLDLMRMNWQRYVIRYSFHDQVTILRAFRTGSRQTLDKIKFLGALGLQDSFRFLKQRPWFLPLLVGMVIGILILTRRWDLNFWRSTRTPFAVTLYRHMLRRLEKRGIRKKPHWTHRELLEHLPDLPSETQGVIRRITGYYEQCRFGKGDTDKKEEQEMRDCLRRI